MHLSSNKVDDVSFSCSIGCLYVPEHLRVSLVIIFYCATGSEESLHCDDDREHSFHRWQAKNLWESHIIKPRVLEEHLSHNVPSTVECILH